MHLSLEGCRYLCTINTMKRCTSIGTALASKLRLSAPLHHTASIFLPLLLCSCGVFPLNRFKNRMTLQSSTDGNIQKCTSVYIFELRVFHWKNSSLLNTPDILSAITSLTFRQTRTQALYMDVQRLIEDFCFNRCPGEEFIKYLKTIITLHNIFTVYSAFFLL